MEEGNNVTTLTEIGPTVGSDSEQLHQASRTSQTRGTGYRPEPRDSLRKEGSLGSPGLGSEPSEPNTMDHSDHQRRTVSPVSQR